MQKKVWKVLLSFVLIFAVAMTFVGCESMDYKKAISLYNEGQYDQAIALFQSLGQYEDSTDMVKMCQYAKAAKLFSEKKYTEAEVIFTGLQEYKDSVKMVRACRYGYGAALYAEEEYQQALDIFLDLGTYEKSAQMAIQCRYRLAEKAYESKDYETAKALFTQLQGYQKSNKYLNDIAWELFCAYLTAQTEVVFTNNNPVYTIKVKLVEGKLQADYTYSGADGTQSQFCLKITYGQNQAELTGQAQFTHLGVKISDEGSALWNMDTYRAGDNLTWDSYTCNPSNKVGMCFYAAESLERLVRGIASAMEQSGVDITVANIGFASFQ